jgi:hypothetical protein
MRKPTYSELRTKYPDRRSVSGEELYQWIGYPSYATDPRYLNTCAVRMSLGLVRCGVPISPGRLRVRAGECKGKMLEPGQANLSRILVRLWGEPEKYKGGFAAKKGIGNRHGVVSFYRLWSPTDQQGHIDMVAPYAGDNLTCEEDCYWMSAEVWFWSLK